MKKQSNEKKQKEEVQESKEEVVVVVEQELQVSNEKVSPVNNEVTKEEIVEKEEVQEPKEEVIVVEQVKIEVPKESELDIKIKDIIKGKEIYSTNDYKLSDEELLYAVEKGFLLQINRYKYKVL